MKRVLAVTILILGRSFVVAAQTADKQVEAELLRITHEINDAGLRGDKAAKAAFERYTADSYIETDFNGKVTAKAKILDNFITPPPSMKPTLELQDVQIHVYGYMAVMSARDIYHAEANGQKITNSFRETDVWLRRNGRWLMVATHVSLIPAEREVAKVDPRILDVYVGDYEIAAGFVFSVKREGDKLMAQTTGEKKWHELLPQNETTFFIKGDTEANIFVKNEKGQVTHIVFRSPDGQEIKAKKIK